MSLKINSLMLKSYYSIRCLNLRYLGHNFKNDNDLKEYLLESCWSCSD